MLVACQRCSIENRGQTGSFKKLLLLSIQARFEKKNWWVSFPKVLKREPYRLPFQEKAAFERKHIT